MNFFEHQDIARRNTRRLVVLLSLAVLSLIAITTLLFAVVMFYFNGAAEPGETGFWATLIDLVGWQSLSLIALTVLAVVALGSLFKFLQLRGGGKAVAESLGGQLINSSSTDPDQRKVLNVVEEMAIASGTPVPPVYLLDEEGINAFAAGHTPQDAVIGITRGAIAQLNRDQLQGVIAHEFSHILHGDMRLNIRLVALLNGILVIGLLGHLLLRSSYYRRYGRSSKNNSHAAIMGLGLGLVIIGYTGTFFGNWIKSAVSRQREFLADASAVQFTRNPNGISGALKKISAYAPGSHLEASDAAEFSHMYFSQGLSSSFARLMATHPPLEDRIRRIEPRWDGSFEQDAGDTAQTQAAADQPSTADTRSSVGPGHITTAMIAASVAAMGQAAPEHLQQARTLLSEMDPTLREAAHDTFSARGIIFGLLLSADTETRRLQWQKLTHDLPEDQHANLKPLADAARQVPAHLRLPLVELTLPALKQLSKAQYQQFKQTVDDLIAADGRINLMEWALARILRHNLEPSTDTKTTLKLRYCQAECQLLLSLLAHAGSKEPAKAEAAFSAASAQLSLPDLTLLPSNQIQLDQLDQALERLRRLKPLEKPALLKALSTCIAHDDLVTATEAELFRALADSLDCPVPPMLPGPLA